MKDVVEWMKNILGNVQKVSSFRRINVYQYYTDTSDFNSGWMVGRGNENNCFRIQAQ